MIQAQLTVADIEMNRLCFYDILSLFDGDGSVLDRVCGDCSGANYWSSGPNMTIR